MNPNTPTISSVSNSNTDSLPSKSIPTSHEAYIPDLDLHSAFELIQHHHIEALSIDVLISTHKQTGAIHYHLAHPSDENAFLIGFRTQPMDSKGAAHILEHTALCGSQKYPVRDPFFSMIKRSLNTFMNAMTSADWTAYPFASQNINDYFNLLSVYLDASFFPILHPLDFAQEGIRVELDDNDKAQFKGIVFNEMKGAMSGEVDQLYHAMVEHLFPTTTYHYNSGGDPADIPDLTHGELVEFHKSHYHPSNSVIMSFGNIPVYNIQSKLHDDALSQFETGKKHISKTEYRLSAPIKVTDTYSVDEITEAQTHHFIGWLLPTITDPKLRLALRLLEGVLIEHAGSPLRAYLDRHELGKSPSPILGLDDSHYEMVFYAGLQGSEARHADAVEQGIMYLLSDIASQPIKMDDIETILHQIEIDQRHIGGDSMPYGLNLLLEGFSTAIHDGNPIDVWEVDEHLAWLREQIKDPMWLPNLCQQYLVDNTHRVRLTLIPDDTKAARLAQQEQARLQDIEANLDETQKAALKQQAQALAKRQSTPDDLSLLPKVGIEDVPEDISFAKGSQKDITLSGQDSTLYQYEAGTNGLYYYQIIIDLNKASGNSSDAIIAHPLLPLYLGLLSELGTDELSAREFQALQAAHSSGVTARISQRTSVANNEDLTSYFVVATRALNRKAQAIDLVKQVLEHSVFDEIERIKELLQQKQSRWQSRLASAGHAYAMQTACRHLSRQAQLEYTRSGLPALNALKSFLDNANADANKNNNNHVNSNVNDNNDSINDSENKSNPWQNLARSLQALHQQFMHLPKQALIICEAEQTERLSQLIVDSWRDDRVNNRNTDVNSVITDDSTYKSDDNLAIPAEFAQLALDNLYLNNSSSSNADSNVNSNVDMDELDIQNTDALDEKVASKHSLGQDIAWLVATNVFHNAAVYKAPPLSHPDSAALMILAPYLRNGYLHSAIRERGGAYGGGAGYDSNACAFKFYSYRDPHCALTFTFFTQSIEWLLDEPQQPDQLEEAILGVISSMDKPGSPAGEAVRACFSDLHGRGEAWQRQMRAKILAVTLDDLKRVAKTYLLDEPFTRATLAPYDKQKVVTDLGFEIHKIKS